MGRFRKNKAMSNENYESAGKGLNTTFVVDFAALIIIIIKIIIIIIITIVIL